MKGISVFRDYFKDFQDQYILIGGAACDLIFESQDTPFRATKDLDIVLLVEALTPEFGRKFWQFIHDGGYEHRAKSNGAPQFYRFDRPSQPEFPYMLELFSRKGNIFEHEALGTCVPIPLGEEVSSLSAILLNEDYYDLLIRGKTKVDGVSLLSPQYLIPFKAKAFLDLSMRKQHGEHIDEKDIRKHRNDIARLATLLTGEEQCNLSSTIRQEMRIFVSSLEQTPVDVKKLHLHGVRNEDILQVLRSVYLSSDI